MNKVQTHPDTIGTVPQIGPVRTVLQYLSLSASAFFALCILFQVFLAGAGIFVSSTWLGIHSALGWLLALTSLLVLILALIGATPRSVKWISVLLAVLVLLQPFLTFVPRKIGLPLLSALHPVNALLIFVITLFMVTRTWQATRETHTKR